ncbi:RDD family protein [Tenacibaculum skagerrakense]|uniref:RDD family protein n=1 Tax=Tenacibaculum skagerrakense TaxID=186571 RepID=A0A4R2NLU1_9FLAO|nr:RDD family protein [Tenacibaculum skagerrakense]TCP22603.1 RDD family protein [Tenacibaculum skagerrakense]
MKEITKGTRFVNYIIDHLIIIILFSIISILLTSSSELMYFLIYIFYYLLLEFLNNGQTIGKLVTKTRVVNLTNEKPTFRRILWRTLLRLNPFDIMSYLVGQEGHDSISKTKLINV